MQLALPFFTVFMIYGVASPFLPVLVRGLGYSQAMVGFLLGLFEIAGIAGPFIFSRLTDRLGRFKPSLALALSLVLIAIFPLSLSSNVGTSAVMLVIFAIGLRSLLPLLDANATLALGPTGDYGKVRVLGSISFVLVALFLQFTPFLKPDKPLRIAFWISLTTAATIASLGMLKEGYPLRPKEPDQSHPLVRSRRSWDPVFIIGLVMIGLGRLAMAPIASFFSLYAVEELHWDAVGFLWAIAAGSEIPLMFLSARLIQRYGSPRLLSISVLAVAVRLAIYTFVPNIVGAVIGQALHSLCFGLFHPAAVAFVATRVPPERRASGMAMYLSLGVALPTFLGSTAGGLIVESWGYRVLFASFIVFALASFAVYVSARKRLEAPSRL